MMANHGHNSGINYVPLICMFLLCVCSNALADKDGFKLVTSTKARSSKPKQRLLHPSQGHHPRTDRDDHPTTDQFHRFDGLFNRDVRLHENENHQDGQNPAVGICQGLHGDPTVRITVSADNSRTLVDTTRLSWVQSRVQCTGKAPKPLRGKCDDEMIRAAWKCENIEFPKENAFPPNFKAMVDPILSRCKGDSSASPSVLMLGLGGGILPSYLQMKCPGINVVTVEKNANVVTVAKDFFAFTGKVIVQDMHTALKDLARKGRRFDAVVSDVGHGVVLGKEGMHSTYALLNPDGIVLEKMSQPDLERESKVFHDFLGHVAQTNLPKIDGSQRNFILFGSRGGADAKV